MTRVVGVDPSLTATGVATPNALLTVKHPRLRGAERLVALRDAILHRIGRADLIVLEGYSYGSQGRAMFDLGELGGVLRVAFHEAGIPWAVVPPAVLKRYATGRGNAVKELVVTAAVRRLDVDPADNNQADAVWLRAMGCDAVGEPLCGMPAAHREALKGVEWPVPTVVA